MQFSACAYNTCDIIGLDNSRRIKLGSRMGVSRRDENSFAPGVIYLDLLNFLMVSVGSFLILSTINSIKAEEYE